MSRLNKCGLLAMVLAAGSWSYADCDASHAAENVPAGAVVIHVQASGSNHNTGASWVSAKATISAALQAAVANRGAGNQSIYVLLAAGVTFSPAEADVTAGRPMVAIKNSDVHVLGGIDVGHDRCKVTVPNRRSILDGFVSNSMSRVPHVVSILNVSNVSVENVVVQNGGTRSATRSDMRMGGGMYVLNSDSVTLKDVTFENNESEFGGAIYVDGSSNFIMERTNLGNSNSAKKGASIVARNSVISCAGCNIEKKASSFWIVGGSLNLVNLMDGANVIAHTSIRGDDSMLGNSPFVEVDSLSGRIAQVTFGARIQDFGAIGNVPYIYAEQLHIPTNGKTQITSRLGSKSKSELNEEVLNKLSAYRLNQCGMAEKTPLFKKVHTFLEDRKLKVEDIRTDALNKDNLSGIALGNVTTELNDTVARKDNGEQGIQTWTATLQQINVNDVAARNSALSELARARERFRIANDSLPLLRKRLQVAQAEKIRTAASLVSARQQAADIATSSNAAGFFLSVRIGDKCFSVPTNQLDYENTQAHREILSSLPVDFKEMSLAGMRKIVIDQDLGTEVRFYLAGYPMLLTGFIQ